MVLVVKIDSLFKQKLNHLVASRLYCVVYRSLAIYIFNVDLWASSNKLLSCLNVTFPNAVENRVLAVFVNVIDVAPVLKQYFDQLSMSLSHCVVKRSLIERVFLFGVNALRNKEVNEPNSFALIFHCWSSEKWGLVEIDRIILQSCAVQAVAIHHLHYFVTVALF